MDSLSDPSRPAASITSCDAVPPGAARTIPCSYRPTAIIPQAVLDAHDIDPDTLVIVSAPEVPRTLLLHDAHDVGDLLCAAQRIAHAASILDRSTRAPDADHDGGFHHVLHHLPDGSTPVVSGVERNDDGRLYERYEYEGSEPCCRRFVLRIEAPRSPDTDALPALPSGIAASRLRSHVRTLHLAAEAAVGGNVERPDDGWCDLTAALVQTIAGTRIPVISASLQTAVFANGHVDVALVPRTPTRLQPADVFRPAALDALKALAHPAGTLEIVDDGHLCTYTVAAVRKVTTIPSIPDDPMRTLRIHASLPRLGIDPFTDALLKLRTALAR